MLGIVTNIAFLLIICYENKTLIVKIQRLLFPKITKCVLWLLNSN